MLRGEIGWRQEVIDAGVAVDDLVISRINVRINVS
jgi:hypothetical protein